LIWFFFGFFFFFLELYAAVFLFCPFFWSWLFLPAIYIFGSSVFFPLGGSFWFFLPSPSLTLIILARFFFLFSALFGLFFL